MTGQEKKIIEECLVDTINCSIDTIYESLALIFEEMAKYKELSLQEILLGMSFALKQLTSDKKDK